MEGTRPKITARNLEQQEAARGRKQFVFALGARQIVVYSLGIVVAMCWMFIFGILVGRGLPSVSSEDFSLRAEFMRFVGLDREPARPPEKAAETWQPPQKMVESLDYYDALTQRNNSAQANAGTPSPGWAQKPPAGKDAAADAKNKQAKALPTPLSVPEKPGAAEAAKPAVPQATGDEPVTADGTAEHFTLLVASLKDVDNAQKLVEQLRAKGYQPRLHTLDLNGGGRWNRVLVGSFRNRESALKFAADFNKKERMEGLVIRESN